jgi:hypothetical protein
MRTGPRSITNEERGWARARALWSATIALSGRILSDVCPVALLINIGIAGMLGSPVRSRPRIECALLALRGGSFRLPSIFVASTRPVECIAMLLR